MNSGFICVSIALNNEKDCWGIAFSMKKIPYRCLPLILNSNDEIENCLFVLKSSPRNLFSRASQGEG